ncbi:serine/threonine-protein kinase [Streptomyces aidingensis]|uniref:Serine/threonine protein kinase n=1 Tax=Streptomyces aidingensis TaxID=910347 RepID=A0A1I1IUP8_9ACTN|nr:serine/threonine-protein kinase [Streptomyces aidingensis]SFC39452.1 Serine/threonine protein kinase [Streptomyces aidingensis]
MAGFEELSAGDPRQVGRYRLVARLGAGGMGRVYLGRSPGGRAVAVKVIRPELGEDPQFRARFAREVSAARRVNGVFTAGVLDADPEATPAWLATAYVPGMPLGEAVSAHGPWPVPSVLALGAGLAEALEVIHAAEVVHRDLKPSNVLLAPDGPRVIDFGISLAAAETTVATQAGVVVGTPGFMAPEQVAGHRVGPPADVFSFGVVLAYTATGRQPFGSGSAHSVNFRAVYEQPDLRALPAALRPVVEPCLAKEPRQRPTVPQLLARLGSMTGMTGMTGGAAGGDGRGRVDVLTGAGWLPEPVAAAVRARSADAEDRPATAAPPPTRAARPAPGPGGRVPPPAGEFGPPLVAPPGPAEGPARTGQGDRTDRAGRPGGPRRRVLLGLGGAVLAAGAGWYGLRALDGLPAGGGEEVTRRPAPGTRLWAFPTGGPAHTAAVAAGVAYFGSDDGRLYAVGIADATERWRFPTGGAVVSPPRVADGIAYTGSDDSRLYAVDIRTGAEVWRVQTEGPVRTPAVTSGIVCAGSHDGRLRALRADNGEELWTFTADSAVRSAAVVGGGLVYAGTAGGVLYARDHRSGEARWEYAAGGEVFSTPVLADGRIFFGSDDMNLYALDAATGERLWSYAADDKVRADPVVAGGTVYVGSSDDRLHAVDAATGDRRWVYPANAAVRSPAVADGAVYIGTSDAHVYALDAADGGLLWQFRGGGEVFSSAAVAGGIVFAGNSDGALYALQG